MARKMNSTAAAQAGHGRMHRQDQWHALGPAQPSSGPSSGRCRPPTGIPRCHRRWPEQCRRIGQTLEPNRIKRKRPRTRSLPFLTAIERAFASAIPAPRYSVQRDRHIAASGYYGNRAETTD